jgi:RecA/RadA recombinase
MPKVKQVKRKKKISMRDLILGRMKSVVFVKPGRVWLDTGDPDCNAVWGSRKLGLPAGKMYHIAGKKHGGKTAFVLKLAGKAQKQKNAFVIYIDAENSFDYLWTNKLGCATGKRDTDYNSDDFYLIYPKVMTRSIQRKKGKKKTAAGTPFLQSCEFLFKEAEEVMHAIKEADPDRPIFVIVDSIANLQPEMAIEAGLTEDNMRTNNERALFLGKALPRWVSFGKNYTMWIMLINQIRTRPGVVMGNPEYSPGGNALDHNCHVMGQIRRKSGVEEKDGTVTGISGYMVNSKNKAGGGSVENQICSYKVNLRLGVFKFGFLKRKGKKKKEDSEK